MTTENIRISKLKLLERNPRRITKDQMQKLCESLKEDPDFLQKRPVLVNEVDGVMQVYAGNQRVRAAKKLGWKTIPCDIDQNLDEKTMKARVAKDNKTFGEFDYDILAADYEIEELIKYGFEMKDFDLDVNVEEITGEEDETELEPPKEPTTKLGDVYDLKSDDSNCLLHHRIICGDSTDPDVVERVLDGREPILMVTDPPYGVEYDPKWKNTALKDGAKRALGKVENDDKVNWDLAWHLFPGSVAYVWHASCFHGDVEKSLREAELEIISQIIWNKQHFAISRGDYHWKHEACLYAVKKGHPHNWQGSRKECTVWDIANLNCFGKSKDEDDRTEHSTQKPIECMSRPIRNNSAPGEEVYDPFLGSGTTLIAAQQLGRVCYGVELSTNYCDVIVNRWVNYMKKNNKEFSIKKNGEDIEWKSQSG